MIRKSNFFILIFFLLSLIFIGWNSNLDLIASVVPGWHTTIYSINPFLLFLLILDVTLFFYFKKTQQKLTKIIISAHFTFITIILFISNFNLFNWQFNITLIFKFVVLTFFIQFVYLGFLFYKLLKTLKFFSKKDIKS